MTNHKPIHTPTPWEVDIDEQNGGGVFVSVIGDRGTTEIYTVKDYGNATREVKADAELIVRAVNAHEEMINLLKELVAIPTQYIDYIALRQRANKIIAQAEGK